MNYIPGSYDQAWSPRLTNMSFHYFLQESGQSKWNKLPEKVAIYMYNLQPQWLICPKFTPSLYNQVLTSKTELYIGLQLKCTEMSTFSHLHMEYFTGDSLFTCGNESVCILIILNILKSMKLHTISCSRRQPCIIHFVVAMVKHSL